MLSVGLKTDKITKMQVSQTGNNHHLFLVVSKTHFHRSMFCNVDNFGSLAERKIFSKIVIRWRHQFYFTGIE